MTRLLRLLALRSRRVQFTLAAGALLVAILIGAGYWLAPAIAMRALPDRLATLLNRPVRLTAIEVDPLRLRMQLHGLHIGRTPAEGAASASPDADGALLTIDRLELDLSVREGSVRFEDRGRDARHALEAIEIHAGPLSTLVADRERDMPLHLSARADGTPVSLQARLRPMAPVPGDEDLRALAADRASAARAWLAGPGGVHPDRVFILAPRTREVNGEPAAPRVEFSLR